MPRPYRLGRRQAAVDRTAADIRRAAIRQLEERPAAELNLGRVAREAGVTRATVYNRFGSRAGLLEALTLSSPAAPAAASGPQDAVRQYLAAACARWASNPALHRHLPPADPPAGPPHELAEMLAIADALRPGCSLREAEDVLAALGSFGVFDRLYRDGRRAPAAVEEILMRMAGGILA